MIGNHRFEVLVVGAGPVGMVTALLLARRGIHVGIVDRESGTARRSYACALHPAALDLLEELGLLEAVMDEGHKVESVSLYEDGLRQSGMDFSTLSVRHPLVLVLPQSRFESIIADALARADNARILWSHRLTDIEVSPVAVVAKVDRLAKSAKGYAVPDVDWETEASLEFQARFLIGADGHHSHVRRCLGIDYERLAESERFAVFEVETSGPTGREVKIALREGLASVMWPFGGHRCRWGFQLDHTNVAAEDREKERDGLDFVESPGEDDSRHQLQRFLHERAPWFDLPVQSVDWATEIQFEHRLVRQYGRGGCWLVGDAAHQTGPVGMHSMNLGMLEGADLVGRLEGKLRGRVESGALETFDEHSRSRWRRLLGLEGETAVTGAAQPWVVQHASMIPPLVPASGTALSELMGQIGLRQG